MSYIDLREESHDTDNVVSQEIVEEHHVGFFAEPHIVCKILNYLGYDQQTTANSSMIRWKFNVNGLGRHESRGNESAKRSEAKYEGYR